MPLVAAMTRRNQRGGGSNSTALLVLLPLVMLMLLGTMQMGVNEHGHQTASAAAQAAAEAERPALAQPGAGQEVGQRVAAQGGLTGVNVSVVTTATTVRVTVTGQAPVLFTVGKLGTVTATATAPKERMS